jgi:hypothetical protein
VIGAIGLVEGHLQLSELNSHPKYPQQQRTFASATAWSM